jgi:hypothetical protein
MHTSQDHNLNQMKDFWYEDFKQALLTMENVLKCLLLVGISKTGMLLAWGFESHFEILKGSDDGE